MRISHFLKSKRNIIIIFLIILVLFLWIKNYTSNSIKEDNVSSAHFKPAKIEGLAVKNMDIDASGTYVVSGTYNSSSTGGRLLETMETKTTEEPTETIVQLYPVFKPIGKDPVGERVFSFQGQMPIGEAGYFSKTLTVKISDTAKSLKMENK